MRCAVLHGLDELRSVPPSPSHGPHKDPCCRRITGRTRARLLERGSRPPKFLAGLLDGARLILTLSSIAWGPTFCLVRWKSSSGKTQEHRSSSGRWSLSPRTFQARNLARRGPPYRAFSKG